MKETNFEKNLRDHGLMCEYVEITPRMAEELLKLNTNNRQIRKTAVAKYAYDFASGSWWESPSNIQASIQIDKSGRLIDGQHRLHAIILSGIPVKMWIFRNVDEKAFDYIDNNIVRSPADVVNGLPDAKNLCALGRIAMSALEGKVPLRSAIHGRSPGATRYSNINGTDTGSNRGTSTYSRVLVTNFVQNHAGILGEALKRGQRLSAAIGGKPVAKGGRATYAFACLIGSLCYSDEEIDAFINSMQYDDQSYWAKWAQLEILRLPRDTAGGTKISVCLALFSAFRYFHEGHERAQTVRFATREKITDEMLKCAAIMWHKKYEV